MKAEELQIGDSLDIANDGIYTITSKQLKSCGCCIEFGFDDGDFQVIAKDKFAKNSIKVIRAGVQIWPLVGGTQRPRLDLPTKYEVHLRDCAELLRNILPIGRVKAIGLLEVKAGIEELASQNCWKLIDENTPKDRYIQIWATNYACPKSAIWNRHQGCFAEGLKAIGIRTYVRATHWRDLGLTPDVEKGLGLDGRSWDEVPGGSR